MSTTFSRSRTGIYLPHSGGGGGGTGYSAAVLADTPLAYYRLGETSGTTMVDSSGNGHNGVYDAGVTVGATGLLAGDTDKALDLPGTGGVGGRTNGTGATWMLSTAVTAECLIQLDSTPTGDIAFVCRQQVADSDSNLKSWVLGYFAGLGFTFQVFVNNSATNSYVHFGTVATGTRYHLAGTYDGSTIRLYINGTQVTSGALSGTLNAAAGTHLEVGMSGHSNLYRLDGRIDEAAFYGSALSATRIAAHYAAA